MSDHPSDKWKPDEPERASGLGGFAKGAQGGGFDSGLGGLGSLGQTARAKHLKTARNIFIFIGVVQVLLGCLVLWLASQVEKRGVGDELRQLRDADGNPVNVAEMKAVLQLAAAFTFGIAVLYFVFAFTVRLFPVPITIAGLILYLGQLAFNVLANPAALANPCTWAIPILIILALARAVKAAFAYERERKLAAESF